MGKTKKEMRQAIKDMVAGLPGREYQKAVIGKIGRDYIHFVSLYEGSPTGKVTIEDFFRTRDLFENATKENGKPW